MLGPRRESYYFPDSHEFLGDDENSNNQAERTTVATTSESQDTDQEESMETEMTSETAAGERGAEKENGEEGEQEMEATDAGGASSEEREGEDGEKAKPQKKEEYNPLIVRRSNRAIKPTKDVDLYLLGAQFGIDVEGSDADSSDQEFAPAVESDGEFQHFILFSDVCIFVPCKRSVGFLIQITDFQSTLTLLMTLYNCVSTCS